MQKHPAGRGAFALRKTRVNLYKMHKGVLGENVQKQKIKVQNEQSIHVSACAEKEGTWQKNRPEMRKMAWQQGFIGVYYVSIT